MIQPGAMALTRMPLKASSSALGDAEAEHGSDIDDGAARAGREHPARGFLRAIEHRVEIGREDAPPFLFRHVDGAAGVRHAGIVDQDGDSAEILLGGVEGRRHRRAVAHIGLDRKSAAAGFFDARLQVR
jgi:hypothetical protein